MPCILRHCEWFCDWLNGRGETTLVCPDQGMLSSWRAKKKKSHALRSFKETLLTLRACVVILHPPYDVDHTKRLVLSLPSIIHLFPSSFPSHSPNLIFFHTSFIAYFNLYFSLFLLLSSKALVQSWNAPFLFSYYIIFFQMQNSYFYFFNIYLQYQSGCTTLSLKKSLTFLKNIYIF